MIKKLYFFWAFDYDFSHWRVYNQKKEFLGKIHNFEWKHTFVWEQEKDIIMSYGCLEQIIQHMKSLGGRE
ncbi:MAG: hypothetical protein ACOCXG_05815 [Nanoarchaeota archaeon]